LLICPTCKTHFEGEEHFCPRDGSPLAASRGDKDASGDPLALYLSDVYTVSCNLAGLPGLSIPCGFTKAGLPVGLQLLGAPFAEEKLLRVARMYEAATDWHARRPGA